MLSFYTLAASGRFGGAASLWSPRLLVAYPPVENIRRRCSQTRRLTVQRTETVALDQASGRVAVAVELVELVGTWQLVRGRGVWLLDQPSLRAG